MKYTDIDVHKLCQKIAHIEFKKHSFCYRCEPEDLASELYGFYLVHTKNLLKEAPYNDNLNGLIYKDLILQLNNIRRREQAYSHRYLIESEILDGTIEGNRYFELLEQAGKLHLWNDNEKIIDTQEKHQSYNRMCNWEKSSELSSIEENEIWSLLQKNLSKRDFEIVQMIMLEEKTEREVAKIVGLSQKAVNKIVNKLRRLKETFKDYR